MTVDSKEFLEKRKQLIINLQKLVMKRFDINNEIKNLQKEMRGLDNYLVHQDIKNWR